MARRLRREERVVAAMTRLSRMLFRLLAAKAYCSASTNGITASARKKTTESPSRKHSARNMGTYAQML